MPKEVIEFAARLFQALEAGYWGDINPELFREISEEPEEEWDEDAVGLAACLQKALQVTT